MCGVFFFLYPLNVGDLVFPYSYEQVSGLIRTLVHFAVSLSAAPGNGFKFRSAANVGFFIKMYVMKESNQSRFLKHFIKM